MRDLFATAASGTVCINGTNEEVQNFAGYWINGATEIARIEVNGDTATDVKLTYFPDGATAGYATAGNWLLTPKGDVGHKFFSAITLASGEVIGIK